MVKVREYPVDRQSLRRRPSDHDWPFIPEHISNDLEQLKGVGIISNDRLKGAIAAIASLLKNPVIMMEYPLGGGKAISTPAKGMQYDRRPFCTEIRKSETGKICNEIEDTIAQLFRGLTKDDLYNETEINIEKNEKYNQIWSNTKQKTLTLRTFKDRRYLELYCPLVGYKALAFPVLYDKIVIGTLYVGEIYTGGSEELVQNCLDKSEAIYGGTISNIREQHDIWKKNPDHKYDEKKLERLILQTCEELDRFETMLKDEAIRQRRGFISRKIRENIKSFYEKLPKAMPFGEEGIQLLWKIVGEHFEDIRNIFKMKFIVNFGGLKSINQESVLSVISSTGNIPVADGLTIENVKYDISKISRELVEEMNISTFSNELFEGLIGVEPTVKESSIIRTFPAPLSQESLIVTWIAYDEIWNPYMDPFYRESGKTLGRAIESLYSIISSTHTAILAATNRTDLEDALRVFGHELGNISSGIDGVRCLNLEDSYDDSIELANKDIEALNEQIYLISDLAVNLTDPQKINKGHFWAFGEYLFKWKNIYRLDLEYNYLNILLPKVSVADPYRSQVFGDEHQIEQVIYNVIRNAIKYCFSGTKIYVDFKRNDLKHDSPHYLTITNYGLQVDEKIDPFEAKSRGSNVAGYEGLGIGLNIAKRIARDHGGTIELIENKQISKFKVPLIESYLNSDFKEKDMSLIPELKEEYNHLKSTGALFRILSQKHKYMNISVFELIEEIEIPTYKVTFAAMFPAKE